MSDVVVARFNEFVAAASLDPDSDAMVDRANEMFPFAPNGVYPTNDGWVAVTVEDDEQYQRLVKLIDKVVLTGPGLETATGRFDARAALDDVIVAYTRDATAVAIAGELRGAGIVAEEVVAPRALPEVAQLVDRGFFTPVDHPVWGRRRLVGVPWRRYGEHALPLHPSPVLEPIDG